MARYVTDRERVEDGPRRLLGLLLPGAHEDEEGHQGENQVPREDAREAEADRDHLAGPRGNLRGPAGPDRHGEERPKDAPAVQRERRDQVEEGQEDVRAEEPNEGGRHRRCRRRHPGDLLQVDRPARLADYEVQPHRQA